MKLKIIVILKPEAVLAGYKMSENVLRIEAKKYREESVVVSARLPKDMLQDIDFVAKESGRTRSDAVHIAGVRTDGSVRSEGLYARLENRAIRPAMWIEF